MSYDNRLSSQLRAIRSSVVRRGVSLVHVQRLLGHADVRTTSAIYTHVGVEDLRQAIGSATQTDVVQTA